MRYKKYYSKDDELFHVLIDIGGHELNRVFDSFYEFAKFLNGDLSDANLYDYDFVDIDLKNYNIERASIRGSILKKLGLLDNSFYESNIGPNDYYLEKKETFLITKSENREIMNLDGISMFRDNLQGLSYITDLHLNHKIKNRFPEYASKQEIIDYIREIVDSLKANDFQVTLHTILIGGDVSFNFEISKIFYQELRKVFKYKKIVVVLGNHELWDFELLHDSKQLQVNPVDYIVGQYRKLFEELKITFLHNELLIANIFTNPDSYHNVILSEQQLTEMSEQEISDKCLKSVLTIYGGLGFSGYSHEYNAESGIYRGAVPRLSDDLRETKKFENIYYKLKRALNDRTVVILSHTPKEYWSLDKYQTGWIYVSGHTHQNYYCVDDEKTIYADNQIGYNGKIIKLKQFYFTRSHDSLKNYADGIHLISKQEYIDFYYRYGVRINYNRENTAIYFLKKNGIYLFIQKSNETGVLMILNGGAIKKLSGPQNLDYYYENLEYYAKSVEFFMSKYNKQLQQISIIVKAFGGTGHIHGSIVDIDFFNHIYLNPFDGKITSYFAYSMTEKYIYKNIPSLLFYEANHLYPRYLEFIKTDNKNQLIAIDEDLEVSKRKQFVADTDMYRFSRIAKTLQYLTKMKVVRTWNDELIKKKDNIESKKLLFNDLIDLSK